MLSDTFSDGSGTSTDFTLYRVGDRGQFTNEGWMRPMLLLALIHTALVLVVYHLVRARGRWRRWRTCPA